MSIKKIPFQYVQVGKGENLKTIAQKYQIDSIKILIDNNLTPKQVVPGIFLKIEK